MEVALINRSTIVGADEVKRVAAALERQANEHFAPWWGVGAHVYPTNKPKPGWAWLTILDNSDMAGALGYHDLTSTGAPLGKVFAKTDKQYGEKWSVTASHELLEMMGDPYINLIAEREDGREYAYECCDPVQGDEYLIDGVDVSNFVGRSWFTAAPAPHRDYMRLLKHSFDLRPGGWISERQPGGAWTQAFGERGPASHGMAARPQVGSRRERRITATEQWLLSTAEHVAD